MKPQGGGARRAVPKGPSKHALEVGSRLLARSNNARVDGCTAELFAGLERAGVEALLLKGPATVRWLYERPAERAYGDTDLLVRFADLDACEEVLAGLGYALHEGPDVFQRDIDERKWLRATDGSKVDVHMTLFGAEADPARVFEVLYEEGDVMDVAGTAVRVPSIPGRACHLALHAAQHSEAVQRPLDDLELALSVADPAVWRDASTLSERIDAGGAFAVGLRLVPQGRAVAAALGLPDDASREIKLYARGAPPLAVGLEYLRLERGWRRKLALVGKTLWPEPDYLVRRHPWAARSRARFWLAHLWHPLWLLKALARALPAYVRAGRRAR